MNRRKKLLILPIFINTIKKSFFYVFLIFTAILASSLIISSPSLMLKKIIDTPLASDGQGLWKYAFIYLAFVTLLGLSDFLREYSSMVLGQRILLNIRKEMLQKLLQLPMSYYLEVPSGETISRFTADVDAVNSLFTSGIISAIADILKIIALMIALFSLSTIFGFVAVGTLPMLFLITNYFRKNIYNKQIIVRKKVSDINTNIKEMYTGIKIIKVFGKESYFTEKFEPLLEKHRIAMNANSIYDAWFPCVIQVLRAIVIAFAIFIGSSNNSTSIAFGLSLGTLAAATDLFIRFFEPIEAISSEIQTIQQASAGLNRIKTFFDLEVEQTKIIRVPVIENIMKNTIVISDVCFGYSSEKEVLTNITLNISPGSKTAIAGRTGSGKTTLMNLVAGLYTPDKGKITIGGIDPYLLQSSERRKLIGVVPQTIMVLEGSICDNVTLRDQSITRSEVENALHIAGLTEVVGNLVNGMDTILGDTEHLLSFGQTQLLALARAIVKNPQVLLFDELTSGLDAVTEKLLLQAIHKISKERIVLTISHRISGIIDADIVYFIEHGRIVESGSPQELVKKEGWYSRYKKLEDLKWRIF